MDIYFRHSQNGCCEHDGARDELDNDAHRFGNRWPADPHEPHLLYDRGGCGLWRFYRYLLIGRWHGSQEPDDNLSDPGLVTTGQGDRGQCIRCRLHLLHARARVPSIQDPPVHLHEALHSVPE